MPKLIRVTTVPMALKYLLAGQMKYMKEKGFEVLMVSADGREREDVIQNETVPHLVIPMTRKITPVADLCIGQHSAHRSIASSARIAHLHNRRR